MEGIYCPVSECSTCSGIGEVLTDTGIRECMTCHGAGHQVCRAAVLQNGIADLADMVNNVKMVVWLLASLGVVLFGLFMVHVLSGK